MFLLTAVSQMVLVPATVGQGTLPQGTAGQSPLSGFMSILGAVVVMVAVLFLAYKSTKLIAGKYSAQSMRGGYIEVLERVVLGQDRSLFIVRLRGRVLLLGVTPHHVEKLDELDPLEYADGAIQPAPGNDAFSSILKDALGKGWGTKTSNHKKDL